MAINLTPNDWFEVYQILDNELPEDIIYYILPDEWTEIYKLIYLYKNTLLNNNLRELPYNLKHIYLFIIYIKHKLSKNKLSKNNILL